MKVLSFSLWGAKAPYTVGAIRNAELALAVYPGWVCRFYCGTSVPAVRLAGGARRFVRRAWGR
jgi:hypothetical protein